MRKTLSLKKTLGFSSVIVLASMLGAGNPQAMQPQEDDKNTGIPYKKATPRAEGIAAMRSLLGKEGNLEFVRAALAQLSTKESIEGFFASWRIASKRYNSCLLEKTILQLMTTGEGAWPYEERVEVAKHTSNQILLGRGLLFPIISDETASLPLRKKAFTALMAKYLNKRENQGELIDLIPYYTRLLPYADSEKDWELISYIKIFSSFSNLSATLDTIFESPEPYPLKQISDVYRWNDLMHPYQKEKKNASLYFLDAATKALLFTLDDLECEEATSRSKKIREISPEAYPLDELIQQEKRGRLSKITEDLDSWIQQADSPGKDQTLISLIIKIKYVEHAKERIGLLQKALPFLKNHSLGLFMEYLLNEAQSEASLPLMTAWKEYVSSHSLESLEIFHPLCKEIPYFAGPLLDKILLNAQSYTLHSLVGIIQDLHKGYSYGEGDPSLILKIATPLSCEEVDKHTLLELYLGVKNSDPQALEDVLKTFYNDQSWNKFFYQGPYTTTPENWICAMGKVGLAEEAPPGFKHICLETIDHIVGYIVGFTTGVKHPPFAERIKSQILLNLLKTPQASTDIKWDAYYNHEKFLQTDRKELLDLFLEIAKTEGDLSNKEQQFARLCFLGNYLNLPEEKTLNLHNPEDQEPIRLIQNLKDSLTKNPSWGNSLFSDMLSDLERFLPSNL